MEATLNIKLAPTQILALLRQLNIEERISIFKEFSDEWLGSLAQTRTKPLSIKQFNNEIEKALYDSQQNKIIKATDLKKQIQEWI